MQGLFRKIFLTFEKKQAMTVTQSLKIYDILNKHFKNEEDARIVIQQIEEIVEAKVENKKDILLTKEDKIDLIDRINKSKLETIIWIVGIGVLQFILSYLMRK
jgi:hypothetical protein